MEHEEQLAWEARAGRLAAAAAFAAGLLIFAGYVYLPAVTGGLPEDADDYLREAEREPTHFIVSGVIIAVATLLVFPALAFLFRATRHRRPGLAPTALLMLGFGTLAFSIVAVWQPIETTQLAKDFFPFQPAEDAGSITDPDEYLEAVSPEEAAEEARRDALPGVVAGLAIGGTIALAFSFVMISLNAMRVGLLSRFMGVLGIIVGVLYVIPLGVEILPLYWFVALGLLFLGRLPGGRGPAWQTGEAIPWPGAAEQREEIERRRAERELEERATADPEPETPRRASRKRRKKRR